MPELKGSAIAPKTETNASVQNTYFSCGVTALQGGNLEEAFLCFSQLPDCCEAYFNLALCYCKAQLYEKALDKLERAEKALSSHASLLLRSTAAPMELVRHDACEEAYRMPMGQQTATFFPVQARLRILRLLADIYGELGYEEEFLRILPSFSGKEYRNVAEIKLKFGEKRHDNQRNKGALWESDARGNFKSLS